MDIAELKNNDIVIRIPKKIYNKNIQALIDAIEFKNIVSKSKATQKDIDTIMKDVKKGRKELMKPLLSRIKQKI
ncbi:MAG: hypothetical protein KF781_07570 [Chitinophagaceae bacterium]|nr:hypothetical protein [Chitinophagaceae bacterium]MCW5905613.1 hypothetical protein [Chitinophagaceae bacterium]